jgi:chromosome segregation ATPase
MNIEGATTKVKDLEGQISQLQIENMNKKKTSNESSSEQLNEAIRSQSTLISSLREKEKQANLAVAKLAKEKEQIELALEQAERSVEQFRKIESESQKQILDMYDQIDKINGDLTAKQREVLEAEREVDAWRAKATQSKQGVAF